MVIVVKFAPVSKRSITLASHKTSVSLEDIFWVSLKEIAAHKNKSSAEFIDAFASSRPPGNLSSQLRQYIVAYYRQKGPFGAGQALSGGQALSAGQALGAGQARIDNR